MLDAGQCNDSYSLAVIALKLKEVFGLDDINDLPIIYNIAWYEGGHCSAGSAIPWREEYSSGTDTASLFVTQCGQCTGGTVRDRRDQNGRRGYENIF